MQKGDDKKMRVWCARNGLAKPYYVDAEEFTREIGLLSGSVTSEFFVLSAIDFRRSVCDRFRYNEG